MKTKLPEIVRVARVGVTTINGMVAAPVKLAVGKDEVAVLLAVRFKIDDMSGGVNDATLRWCIYRKSEGDPPEGSLITQDIQDNDDIIAGGGFYAVLVTSGAVFGTLTEDFVFPYPVVLVRPCQVLFETSYVGIQCGMYLYYLRQKIGDDDLTKLLVKDHA